MKEKIFLVIVILTLLLLIINSKLGAVCLFNYLNTGDNIPSMLKKDSSLNLMPAETSLKPELPVEMKGTMVIEYSNYTENVEPIRHNDFGLFYITA